MTLCGRRSSLTDLLGKPIRGGYWCQAITAYGNLGPSGDWFLVGTFLPLSRNFA